MWQSFQYNKNLTQPTIPASLSRSSSSSSIHSRSKSPCSPSAGGGALGDVPMVGSPIRLDGERNDAPLPPPALGEHTAEILAQIEIDRAELDRLKAAGIIG